MVKNNENLVAIPEVCDISDVLEKFGKYHYIQFALLCLPVIVMNMVNVNYIFVAGDLNYRCRIPECESLNTTFEVAWWPNASIERCSEPVLRTDHVQGSGCTNSSFSGELRECRQWVYETNNTVIAELNLACRPWLSNLIGTIRSSGTLISSMVAGKMSDRFGRKPTFIFCMICSTIGQLKAFTASYITYVAIEFLEAILSGGSFAVIMMLMLEICGKENRLLSGIIFAYAVYFGECLFAIISMFVPYWKTLIRIIYSPSIFFISYIFLIRESPRWQILNGKTEQAKDTLLTVAKMNKININRQELSELDEVKLKNKFNIRGNEKREGLKAILTSKEIMKRVLVASVCRFTVNFIYYGMMINSVYLPGDKYTNFFLASLMSFPGELLSLYLMNKLGRKMPLLVGFLVCGVLCVGTAYVPASYIWMKIILFLIGKMLISVCFTGAIMYIMELYPTSVRGTLLGFGAVTSRFAGMMAPLTPVLNPISTALPSILFGCAALLASGLLTLTPETRDLPLMDTIRQVEDSVKNTKERKKKRESYNSEDKDVANDILLGPKNTA